MRLWEIGIPVLRQPSATLSQIDRALAEVFSAPLQRDVSGPSGVFVEFFPGHGPVLEPANGGRR